METPTAKQNPFSLYDFIGYFVPGFYLVILILFVDVTFNNHKILSAVDNFYSCVFEQIFSDDSIEKTEKPSPNGNKTQIEQKRIKQFGPSHYTFITIPGAIIFFYILGHLISLLSNLIIEEFPVSEDFRRPYKIMLKEKNDKRKKNDQCNEVKEQSEECCFKTLLQYIFCIFPCPVKNCRPIILILLKGVVNFIFWTIPLGVSSAIVIILFQPIMSPEDKGKLSVIKNFYKIQPLGDPGSGQEKILKVLKRNLGENVKIDNAFNYLMNIVLKNCPSHVWKIQNYVALYGFMRNLLMANIFAFYFALCVYAKGIWFFLIFILLMNAIFFYGYLKYVRRYTEEVVFAACAIDLPPI